MYWLVTILNIFMASEAAVNLTGLEWDSTSTEDTSCGVRPISCSDSDYRTYDGSCNNLEHGWWATPYTPYLRLLNNNYADGIHAFPISVKNKELPNVREVSLRTFVDIPKISKEWTLAFMQYGQVVAHDLSLTAGISQLNTFAACCTRGKLTDLAATDPRCAPISIPENDPYNTPEGRECFDFLRTLTTKDIYCTGATEVAEPLTAVTGFLDLSYVYGSDEKIAKELREFEGGRLRFLIRKGKEMLPQALDPTVVCAVKTNTEPCYLAGDVRVNQNPQLALLQNLYLVHHNSIARDLAELNPQWDDERVFQVTRQIVAAQHQHVIYYEFLPILIGEQNMINNKLMYPNATDHINDYNPKVDPGVANEFATAAYRLYHTEIVGGLKALTENRNLSNLVQLSNWFDRPGVCEYADNYNGLTRGLATQGQGDVDRFIDNDVLNLLFKDGLLGDDLKAIDIMRSRDHGLATYAQALKAFGLSNPREFKDFEKFIKKDYVDVLAEVYESYEDVDLAVGCFLENNVKDALAGPTTQYILTEQFLRSRIGDRYFYENKQHKSAFTRDQLNEIRRTSSMARFLCYSAGVKLMQREAFSLVSDKNPLVSCDGDIPLINISLWKECQ